MPNLPAQIRGAGHQGDGSDEQDEDRNRHRRRERFPGDACTKQTGERNDTGKRDCPKGQPGGVLMRPSPRLT